MFVLYDVCKCAYVLHCCNIVAVVVDAYFVISYDVFFCIVCANKKEISLRQRESKRAGEEKTSVERENKLRCDDDDGGGETATAVQSIISFSV